MRDKNGVKLIPCCEKHNRVKPFNVWQTTSDENLKELEKLTGVIKKINAVCDKCEKGES